MENKRILQDWILTISFKQQMVVFIALVDCDFTAKYDTCRPFLHKLRSAVLRSDVLKETSEIKDAEFINISQEDINNMKWDEYPLHFVAHFMHAVEIIGYHHPDKETRNWFKELYFSMVDNLHLHPESKEECDFRLRDGVEPEPIEYDEDDDEAVNL